MTASRTVPSSTGGVFRRPAGGSSPSLGLRMWHLFSSSPLALNPDYPLLLRVGDLAVSTTPPTQG